MFCGWVYRELTNGQILTGATGSAGAHVLWELLQDDSIPRIYCLTRRSGPEKAILQSLQAKGMGVTPDQLSRIVALRSDLTQPDLGVGAAILREMRRSVAAIIHAAWTVNFALPLWQFETDIKGLHNLLNFSLSVDSPHPAVVLFCSSISTALGSLPAGIERIEETPLSFDCALPMGYSHSKFVGESIVHQARAAGARSYSVRIGQISGHSERAGWNETEAVPLLIRSALTLHALPAMEAECSWIPVDTLARCLCEITASCLTRVPDGSVAGADDGRTVYNLVNPHTFRWSSLLAELRRNGFYFETVPLSRWLELLQESEDRLAPGDAAPTPAVKLIDHYRGSYRTQALQSKPVDMRNAFRDSAALRGSRIRIIDDGILGRYARDWMQRWGT